MRNFGKETFGYRTGSIAGTIVDNDYFPSGNTGDFFDDRKNPGKTGTDVFFLIVSRNNHAQTEVFHDLANHTSMGTPSATFTWLSRVL